MRFLVSRFKSFFPLSNVSPKRKHHKQPTKARITPLPILDVNEGKTDGNITVLDSFAADIRKKDITPEIVPRTAGRARASPARALVGGALKRDRAKSQSVCLSVGIP